VTVPKAIRRLIKDVVLESDGYAAVKSIEDTAAELNISPSDTSSSIKTRTRTALRSVSLMPWPPTITITTTRTPSSVSRANESPSTPARPLIAL
jgi:hypothetical protein